MNNSGAVAGFFTDSGEGFIWQNGVFTDLGTDPTYGQLQPYGINDSGTVCGGYNASGPGFVRTANGTVTNYLPTDANGVQASDVESYMTGGINNAGQVIGTMDVNDGSGVKAYLHNPDGSTVDIDPAFAAVSGYGGSMAFGISNSGLVVGMDVSEQVGYVFNSNTGNATLLPGAVSLYPGSVNSSGQICGSVSYNGASQNAIYTYNGDGNPVTTTPLSFVPNGINDLGDVVALITFKQRWADDRPSTAR